MGFIRPVIYLESEEKTGIAAVIRMSTLLCQISTLLLGRSSPDQGYTPIAELVMCLLILRKSVAVS